MDAKEAINSIHRTAQFDRCLEDLRKKGGTAAKAANKALDFINIVTGTGRQGERDKFSFTRHGEARIRNCRKLDVGCGYRLVCLLRDGQLTLLYAGSHDECSRWLMRNRRMNYEFDDAARKVHAARECGLQKEPVPGNPAEDCQFSDRYESELMSKIDDAMLRKIFAGLVNGRG